MTKRPNPKKQKLFYSVLLVASLLAFFISAYFASSKSMMPWEKTLLVDIYNHPPALHWFGLIVTQFGSAWMLAVVATILLIGRKRSQAWGRFVIINGIITYALVETAKRVIGRPRPAELIAHLFQGEPFVRGFGFPSGHTAMATVVSLTLIRFMPRKWRWLPLLWIPLVAWSRLYLGVHAPLDIVGGFTLGLSVISTERLIRIK